MYGKFSISPFKVDFSQFFKSSPPKVGCHGIIAIALLMYGVRWGALFLCFEMTTAYMYMVMMKRLQSMLMSCLKRTQIYVFRYVGYSYIMCAWYAFPFEALEVFTFYSLQVLGQNLFK